MDIECNAKDNLHTFIVDASVMSERKQNLLKEFKRRNMLVQLRRELHPIVGDWWWARDEVLYVILNDFESSGTHAVIDGFVGWAAPSL